MCGIAGAIDLTGTREFSRQRLLAMTGAIAHRGPDDEQFHIEPGVALGARRLSIIDLAGGRQPIANEDGSVWVAFNGELFEYPELRAGAAGPRAPPGHPLRHRGVGPPLRGPGEGMFEQGPRPVRRLALGPQHPDADPRPRPGRDLPALLRRGRRLAALGLGDQGAAGLGAGRRAARPAGHRPPLHVLLRGDDADVLRGDQVAAAGPFPQGSGRPGRAKHRYWDLDFPDAGARAPARRPDAAGRRARGACCSRPSSAGSGATCRWSATSAAGSIRRSSSACAAGSGASRSRRSRSGFDKAGPDERPHATEAARGARLAADHGHDGSVGTRRRVPGADPGGRGAGARYLVRGPAAAGRRRCTSRATRSR